MSAAATVRDLTYAAMSGARPPSHATHDRPVEGCLACALTILARETREALAADQTGDESQTAPTTEGDQGHDRA